MARQRSILAALLLVLAASPAAAQQSPPPIEYDTFTLANGLKFIVYEDHSTPIVAINTWYDVGSAHEVPGRTGFAHFFEHMTFQETQNLEKGQMDKLVGNAGGFINGTTSTDRTAYYLILPSNQVNVGLWMEAERMARLQVSESNFEREREVVKEERRMRIENTPYGEAIIARDSLAFDWRAYKGIPIGTMEDLNAATVDDVRSFYRQFYVPNNATISVTGDVTVAEVKRLAEQYFAGIPRGPENPALTGAPAAPRTDGERRALIESKLANLPLIFSSYNIPAHREDDSYALQLLANILGGGESSRLKQRLVQDEKVALDAFSFMDSRQYGGLLVLGGLPTQGTGIERLEELINAEVQKVVDAGVTERELQKAKNQNRSSILLGRLQVFPLSESLQHARLYHGTPEAINSDLQKFDAVTVADIQRVARKYLNSANRSVVTAVPAGQAAARPSTD